MISNHKTFLIILRYRRDLVESFAFAVMQEFVKGSVQQLLLHYNGGYPSLLPRDEGGVFEDGAQVLNEVGGLRAIHDAVVGGEGDIHKGLEDGLTAGIRHELLDGAAYGEDADLRRVDDGGEAIHAEHAEVADGEGSVLHVVELEGAGAGTGGEIVHGGLNIAQGAGFGMMDDGHDEARVEGDSDTDVGGGPEGDFFAVGGGVEVGMAKEDAGAGFDEQGGDREFVSTCFEAGAQRIDGGGIDLRIEEDVGRGLETFLEAGGDGAAHAFDFDGAREICGGRGSGWLRRRLAVLGGSGEDILGLDASTRAGAGDGGEIEAVLAGGMTGGRRGTDFASRMGEGGFDITAGDAVIGAGAFEL